jgi:hypothetical protein
LIILTLFLAIGTACSGRDARNDTEAASPKAAATPSKNFTPADVAKLKWLEGTWRGMDGDKPFYERYRIEGTAMIVETLKEDGSPSGDVGRFELKDGEFGKGEGDKRSAASEITDSFVQFVPAVTPTDDHPGTTPSPEAGATPPKTGGEFASPPLLKPGGELRNSFRFERQSDGTWMAILEWSKTADKPARGKVYKMEPWQPKK